MKTIRITEHKRFKTRAIVKEYIDDLLIHYTICCNKVADGIIDLCRMYRPDVQVEDLRRGEDERDDLSYGIRNVRSLRCI